VKSVVSHDGSVGEWVYLTACPTHGPGLTPSHGGVFQGIFPRMIRHTWRGDGRRQLITNPLKVYEEYRAAQQDLDSDTSCRRAAVLYSIFMCHILDTIKDTFIHTVSYTPTGAMGTQ